MSKSTPTPEVWTEPRPNVWRFGDTTIRRVKVLRGAFAWRITFPDGRTFTADTLVAAQQYAEERLARLAAIAQTERGDV